MQAEREKDFLVVEGISKQLGAEVVLNKVSLQFNAGQKLAVAGATGSGKSTLLKAIAGLVQVDSGKISFRGETVVGPDDKLLPGHKGIAYLSQHFELRNHYRVAEILSYANLMEEPEAAAIYEVCRIGHLLARWTSELSGGEKQRIALARLLIGRPELLLLDEPYSNLDMIHKSVLKAAIADLSDKLGITVVLVSHDPDDVLPWADEMLVMRAGEVVQRGKPQDIYWKPVDTYVAGLLGGFTALDPEQAGVLGLAGPVILRPGHIQFNGAMEAKIMGSKFVGYGYTLDLVCLGVPLVAFTADAGIASSARVLISVLA